MSPKESTFSLENFVGKDWYDELPLEIKKALLVSLRQAKAGNTITHEQFTKKLSKKYPQLKF